MVEPVLLAAACSVPEPVRGSQQRGEASISNENLRIQPPSALRPLKAELQVLSPYQALPVVNPVITHNLTAALPVMEQLSLSKQVQCTTRATKMDTAMLAEERES